MSRFRNFVFTSYDTELDHQYIASHYRVRYLALQLEEGNKKHTLHYQGYCELRNGMSLTAIKKMFRDRTLHVEKRRGTAQEASDYATKAETRKAGPYVYGDMSNPGERTDLKQAITELKVNGMRSVVENFPSLYVRNFRGLSRLEQWQTPPVRPNTKIIIYHGKPGTGKSTAARERFPNAAFVEDNSHGWFDGYNDESVVIIDEFMCNFPLQFMLKLCESGPLRAPVKGGYVTVRCNTIVLTTNMEPKELYYNSDAFQSRIESYGEIHHLTKLHRGVG